METVINCPLGQKCEEAKDGKVYRCAWLLRLARTDEAGRIIEGSQYEQCAIPALSGHLSNMKDRIMGVQQAVESRGNEQIKRADAFLNLAIESKNAALPRQ